MGFLGFSIFYAMRVNLNVAIVAMVNHTAIIPVPNNTDTTCPIPTDNNSTVPGLPDGEFDWDPHTQGTVIGCFFYGYILSQIPGGRFAERLGGKMIYGIGILLSAICTILTPLAARWNFNLLIAVRVLQGLFSGVTFPAMHAILAKWVPPLKRSKFAGFVYAGAKFGKIIAMPVSGWLCTLEWMDGWPLAFYVFGALGVLWFVAWMWLVYDSPDAHPRITDEERHFIQQAIKPPDEELVDARDHETIPWWSMLKCPFGPSWSVIAGVLGRFIRISVNYLRT